MLFRFGLLNAVGTSMKLLLPLCILLSAFILTSCGESPDTVVPVLIKELQSKDSQERNRAALKLASYGDKADPATKELIHLLKDDNGGVRSSAAYALRKIGSPKAQAALDNYQK